MDNKELASKIVEFLGGVDNVVSAENCMTRIRATVNDPAKTDVAGLKGLDDVLGVIADEPAYIQVILGPGKVRDITMLVKGMGIAGEPSSVATENWQKNKDKVKGNQRQNAFMRNIRVLADIFTPMIPAFIASGICNGMGKIIGIMIKNGIIPSCVQSTVVMNLFALIGSAFLSYLAIFTGVNAAKQFGVNKMLGGMIGGASLSSVIVTISTAIGWYNADSVGNSVLATGAGGIIGVIVGVWILSKVEHWIHLHMPSVLDVSFTPLLSMVVTMPLFVLLIMPATGWLSNGIAVFLGLFVNSDNPVISVVTGYVLAAVFLPLVLLGLHRGLVPIYALQIDQGGSTTLFPAVAMAGAGQVGAAIALYLKARKCGNTRLKRVIAGALPAGILGIGEPLIYGVTLPMMKPFITAGLGAGFGGAYCMLMHVASTAYSPSGILGTSIMLPECMLNFIIGILISYVMGAIITYLFIPLKDVENA